MNLSIPSVSEKSLPDANFPVEYSLSEISLTSYTYKNGLDLRPYFIELNYFEDIFSNFVSAKLVLSDAVGVFLMGGLNGTETVKFKFCSGMGGTPIEMVMQAFAVADRHIDNSMNFENYTLELCSYEVFTAEKYRFSKSYPNQSIDNIIKDILQNQLKTPKKIDIESTAGQYNFVLPNKKLYETINWLAMYAQPQSKVGADMLFYENRDGLHFRSLQSLYSEGKNNIDFTYSYNPKNIVPVSSSPMLVEEHTIYRLQILNNFDTLSATSQGTFNNRVISLDTMLRQKYVQDFDYSKYFSQAATLNDKDVTKNNNSSFNQYTDLQNKKINESPSNDLQSGALRLMISNSDQQKSQFIQNSNKTSTDSSTVLQNDFFIEKCLTNRVAQLFLSQYNRIKILVPGNSTVKVGDVIDVKIYATAPMNSLTSSRGEDTYLSGNYLITAVRHIININRYTTVIELAKESISNNG